MMRQWRRVGAGLVLAWSWAIFAPPASSQEAQPAKPCYTRQEYDVFNAAANEKNSQQRLRLLDEFVAKFPNVCSELMIPALRSYLLTYNDLRSYPKVIEFADKLLLLVKDDLIATYYRTAGFLNSPIPDDVSKVKRAEEVARQGLSLVQNWSKPEGMTDEQYVGQKKVMTGTFTYAAGLAPYTQGQMLSREIAKIAKQKPAGMSDADFAARKAQLTSEANASFSRSIEQFDAVLKIEPNSAYTLYLRGVAMLQTDPPNSLDGFWSIARAIALKVASEAQVRTYLRAQMLRYQQPGCDKLLDAEMNEILTLAAGTADRPASYRIPSLAELEAAQKTMTVLTVISDLKAGGDKAKLIWLAACGLEFPDVPGKLIEVAPSPDSVVLKLFLSADEAEAQAATTPNMEVKVVGQPEVARLEKDDVPHFTGTLTSYDPEPFMLHWEKAKVNPEDIPAAKTAPTKQPAKKAPAKRPPVKKSGA